MMNLKRLILFVTMIIVLSSVNIYAATIGDRLEQPEAGWRRYDDTHEYITYEGSKWNIGGSSSTAYGGSNHHILRGIPVDEIKLHIVKFSFVGTQLRLIGNLDIEHTKQLKIKVDGELIGTFNAWKSGTFQSHTVVAEKTGLSNGRHDVEIYSDDEGRFNCDAIDINEDGYLISSDTPIAPINLRAVATNTNIVLEWDEVDGADNYTILRSTNPNQIDTEIASGITNTTYVDEDVVLGVTYYYVVRAIKDGLESENSNVASAMIEKNNVAVLQIKLVTTDIYEYRVTMDEVDSFKNWYIDRANGNGLPFYSFNSEGNMEPYTDVNEYLIFDKIVWFKVKEYLK